VLDLILSDVGNGRIDGLVDVYAKKKERGVHSAGAFQVGEDERSRLTIRVGIASRDQDRAIHEKSS